MTKDEALKMAIEYIDKLKTTGQTNWLEINVIQNACKEALEQPKKKKYLYVINNWGSLRLSEGRTLQSNEFLVGKIEVQDD